MINNSFSSCISQIYNFNNESKDLHSSIFDDVIKITATTSLVAIPIILCAYKNHRSRKINIKKPTLISLSISIKKNIANFLTVNSDQLSLKLVNREFRNIINLIQEKNTLLFKYTSYFKQKVYCKLFDF